jgi:hypothetical protein
MRAGFVTCRIAPTPTLGGRARGVTGVRLDASPGDDACGVQCHGPAGRVVRHALPPTEQEVNPHEHPDSPAFSPSAAGSARPLSRCSGAAAIVAAGAARPRAPQRSCSAGV